MQLVIFPNDPRVFATHDDWQDLTGLYGAVNVPIEGGGTFTRPAAEIVQVPNDATLPRDDDGFILDPRAKAA
jgi:hypothetical protein